MAETVWPSEQKMFLPWTVRKNLLGKALGLALRVQRDELHLASLWKRQLLESWLFHFQSVTC